MQDLRMIFGYGKPYRKDLFAAVGLIFVECIFEMVIPVLMSTLVDDGVPDHNMAVIFRQGGSALCPVRRAVCQRLCVGAAPGGVCRRAEIRLREP